MIPELTRLKRFVNPGACHAGAGTLDMGQGRTLDPEDVLDGHFRRLSSRPPRTETVAVQSSDTLTSAITVLAPELAPLTDLAEELATTVPDIQPEARFRADLHRALEATHRQHAAQRALGTRPLPPDDGEERSTLPWLATALLVFVFVWLWRHYHDASAR